MTKQQEWKTIDLARERLDFTGALESSLENTSSEFISLTFRLKNGKTVRIRKKDYSVSLEEPIIPTETVYLAKTNKGLSLTCKTRDEAEEALRDIEGEIQEIQRPITEKSTQVTDAELVF